MTLSASTGTFRVVCFYLCVNGNPYGYGRSCSIVCLESTYAHFAYWCRKPTCYPKADTQQENTFLARVICCVLSFGVQLKYWSDLKIDPPPLRNWRLRSRKFQRETWRRNLEIYKTVKAQLGVRYISWTSAHHHQAGCPFEPKLRILLLQTYVWQLAHNPQTLQSP